MRTPRNLYLISMKDNPKSGRAADSRESQRYDKVFRQNMFHIMPGIIEKILQLHICSFEELKDKQQSTKQLEVDVLRKVTDEAGLTYVLHIEIQKENDKLMPYRMAEYHCMLHLNHHLPVQQHVLYIGSNPLTMPNCIDQPNFRFSYQQINLSELPYQLFINAQRPEERILAILAHLGDTSPIAILEELVTGIERQHISVADKQKYLEQLRILVQLRNFTEEMEVVMIKASSFFKEENDPFFRRGEAKGKALGSKEKSTEVVKNLLTQTNFDNITIAQLAGVKEELVQKMRNKLPAC